jgi:hypothetical protein
LLKHAAKQWCVLFLSKAERDLLLHTGEINKTQQPYIRYKLRRKIKQFYGIELPLLIDHGYIAAGCSGVAANNSCSVAAVATLTTI